MVVLTEGHHTPAPELHEGSGRVLPRQKGTGMEPVEVGQIREAVRPSAGDIIISKSTSPAWFLAQAEALLSKKAPFMIVGKGKRAREMIDRFRKQSPGVAVARWQQDGDWIAVARSELLEDNPIFVVRAKDGSWAAPPQFFPS